MNQLRRTFLKGTGAAGTVAVALVAGLLKPGTGSCRRMEQGGF